MHRDEREQSDLIWGGLDALVHALSTATAIGWADHRREARGESAPQRTGQDLAALLCVPGRFRRGHTLALRDAYRIGRLHASWEGRD